MQDEILSECESRMAASVRDAEGKLSAVRTGRASLSLLDAIRVDYYGSPTPLNQVAKLSIPEPSMIVAQPFDTSVLEAIERAIMTSDLGLNPGNDGKIIRIPIPPLTEERRKQLVKKVKQLGEDGKTAVRQIRRDSNETAKSLQKEGELSEDDAKRCLDAIQKLTDKKTGEIDALCTEKEKDLMEV